MFWPWRCYFEARVTLIKILTRARVLLDKHFYHVELLVGTRINCKLVVFTCDIFQILSLQLLSCVKMSLISLEKETHLSKEPDGLINSNTMNTSFGLRHLQWMLDCFHHHFLYLFNLIVEYLMTKFDLGSLVGGILNLICIFYDRLIASRRNLFLQVLLHRLIA